MLFVFGVFLLVFKFLLFMFLLVNNLLMIVSLEESLFVFFNDNKWFKIVCKVLSIVCGLEVNNLCKINVVKCLCCFGKV